MPVVGLAMRACRVVNSAPTPPARTSGLAAPFKGITATGEVEPNLFGIRSIGVSTEPVRRAAEAFLGSITPAQRGNTVFPADDIEGRKWMNTSFYVRQGVRACKS